MYHRLVNNQIMGNNQSSSRRKDIQQFRAPNFVLETNQNGVSFQFHPGPANVTIGRPPPTRRPNNITYPPNKYPPVNTQQHVTLNVSPPNKPGLVAPGPRYCLNKKPIQIVHVHQLKFHGQTYGKHIMLSDGQKTATRIGGKTNCALVFSDKKIGIDEKVSIQITDVNTNLSDCLRIGFVHDNMRRLGALCKLPETLCPEYIDEGKEFAWGREVSAEYAKLNNIITLELTANGTAIIYVNGINQGIFLRGINVKNTLHFVADVYGTTTAIRCTDFPHDREVEIEKGENLEREVTKTYLDHFCQQHGIDPTSSEVDTNLYFLPVSRKNLLLSCDNKLMRLQNDFNRNSKIVFIDGPLQADTSFLFECVRGGFMIGVTNCNPSSIKESDLPSDHSRVKNRPEYWVFDENFLFLDDSKYFAITLTSSGNIMFDCELSDTETIIETDKTVAGKTLHLFFIFALPNCTLRTAGTLKHGPVPDLPSGINRAMYNEHLKAEKEFKKQQEEKDVKKREQLLKQEEINKLVSAAMDEIRPVSIEENTNSKEEQSTPVVDLHPTATSSDSEETDITYHDAPSEFTCPKELAQSPDQILPQTQSSEALESLHLDSITKPMRHDTSDHDGNNDLSHGSSMITNEYLSLFNASSTTRSTSMLSMPAHAQPTIPKQVGLGRQMSTCSSTATMSLSDEIFQPQPVLLTDTHNSSGVFVEDLSVILPNGGLSDKANEIDIPVFAEKEDVERECVICYAEPKTHAFIPCGHLCVCKSCSTAYMRNNNTCLICRKPAESVYKIYHS